MSPLDAGPRPKQVDDPSADVHVQALAFDVCALAPGEMRRRGVALDPQPVHVGDLDRPWRTHSEYAALSPSADHMDRARARQRMHRHADSLAAAALACPQCGSPRGTPCMARPGVPATVGCKPRLRALREQGGVTLEGLRLQRTFPCLGTFRLLERYAELIVVQCDACGEWLAVRPPEEPEAGGQPEAEAEPEPEHVQDDIPL